MARKLRVSYPGVAEHIIQRGNNRQVTFAIEEAKYSELILLCPFYYFR